jgi:hypothetical protein
MSTRCGVENKGTSVNSCGYHVPLLSLNPRVRASYPQKSPPHPQLSTDYPQLGVKNGKTDNSAFCGAYRACCLILLVSSVTWL